ncbi:MAG: 2,3-bisphosphoglycerate-independent phosphoglycerate mutase [Chloroflexi bacterium]|nr:2,3-bisphosphoglycerate-independent phosphoglycerate mutase [Chloroflexota bacterium]
MDFPHLQEIVQQTDSRIVFLVVDGLGGVPHPATGRSELEVARVPNLNSLAGESACGLLTPVLPGVTPGSGPGHLALFGYDPVRYTIGRGVLEAFGIGLELSAGQVAARGNFCTVDEQGIIVDRRAGRIESHEAEPRCRELDRIRVSGGHVSVHPVKDHRFVLVLSGNGLSERVSETDPQKTGVTPLEARPLDGAAATTASMVNEFVSAARRQLMGQPKANMVLLRGFSQAPAFPSMAQAYQLSPAAIAAYPMYRGLAKLVGMTVIPTGSIFREEVDTLEEHFREHDFFFLHYKNADAAGEDGDFEKKVAALEELDALLQRIVALKPDVLVVTGDHATPSILAGHSWHPVPVLIHSPWTKGEGVNGFNERACGQGSLGRIPSANLMFLALAHAGKLKKFGP